MSERCRYGRDSEIYYLDSKGERQLYECPHETEEEGFCIFHKEDYWNQNEETAQRVRNAFLDELRNNETEEDLLCIGYHLPPIGGIAREITELSRNVNFARGIFQLIDFNGVTFQGNVRFDNATFESRAMFHRAIFQGEASFSDATFQGEAGFYNAIFEDRAGFRGVTFQGEASFSNATFQGAAAFYNATFQGKAWFNHITFQDLVVFYDVIFEDFAGFYDAIFENRAGFRGVTFQGEASFSGATFQREARFSSATFQGEARFYDATFESRATFYRAIFQGETSFSSATFQGEARFYDATFEGLARFGASTFQGETRFYDATFEDWAVFSGATFQGEAGFDNATFEILAAFDRTTFQGEAGFDNATFEGLTVFDRTTFQGLARFSAATFQGETRFCDATFESRAEFDDCAKFKKKTDFRNTRFKKVALFKATVFIKEIEEPTDQELGDFIWFRGVEFDSPEKIIFENCSLKYVSFIHTDITRVSFRNIKWPAPMDWNPQKRLRKVLSRLGKLGKLLSNLVKIDAYKLLDEVLFERKKKSIHSAEEEEEEKDRDLIIGNVLTVYRMLRENYEYHVDYENAGRFFVGEMEARKRDSNFFLEIIVLESYKYLSMYGQSYARPLFALIVLILFFHFLVGLVTNVLALFQDMPINIISGIKDSFIATLSPENLFNSLAISFQLQEETEGVYVIQRILSILLLVLFGLALRRRFERRFRH